MLHDEVAEELIEECRLIQTVLGMNREQLMIYKISAADGLKKFGNPFEAKLGEALLLADTADSVKILNVFQKVCVQYDWLLRIFLAKEKARLKEVETAVN